MHDSVQPNYVVDSHADYTSDSNMIPYHQYVKDNAVPVVQSNVSSVPNDAYMMILNDMHEQPAQHVSVTTQNNVVDKSLTAELATYKEQVELYKRRVRFELTEREQKIDEQLKRVITDRNIKEENLKKELHSVKKQLASTINHNMSMRKVAIGYKSHVCLARAKQVQPALYNGLEIIKSQHVPAIVHNSEDTIVIAEITSKKIIKKIKTPLWTHNKINIRPPDYSKENFLATFTPQTQLTPKQIFWSKDVVKMKTKALTEQDKAAKPVRSLTVYPLNTPVKLVPRVLPTKIQVKINIFALIQLFWEFEKTCKMRITPTGLTEGEKGFEQTNECFSPRNNREVHLEYLKHLKESVATIHEIVEEARVERPLNSSLAFACLYTKRFQELVEYAVDTCLNDFNKRDKKQATTPLIRKKQVTFVDQCETSNTNAHKHVEQQTTQKTYVPVIPSTGVNSCTDASGSKPRSNTKKIGSRRLQVSTRRP
uniref:Integrase, catalytic region, zinc finger, CCHC-type, peptidase aspartic, catalytic n=1 Tax=Tanacetum cinerariifolium TaxID=118510 RepID=A0A6L2MEL9_TANCI|nr:hypothetical protein [Tanacetum cinerariifolium]